MKSDQKRVSALLVQTVSLLCKNGLHFEKNLHIQGLLAITVDEKDVFIVQLDDNLRPKKLEKSCPVLHGAVEPSIGSLSPDKSDHHIDHHHDSEKTSEDKLNDHADKNDEFLEHYNYHNNITSNHDEENETQNEDQGKDGDEIIFIKAEMSALEDKNENETSSILSSSDLTQNMFKNDLIPISQFSDPYHMHNNHKHPLEKGRKRRNHRRPDDNMAPIENLENSLVSSYDNFHPYKNDQSTDLVKESWTYTKYHHSFKHSPKLAQSNYTSPTYADNDSLMLFNRNDNHSSISNNNNNDNSNSDFKFNPGNNNTYPRRRSNMKTVVCQYPDCGKTFCHSCHLYRHQRLKHGHRYGVVSQASFKCQHAKCGKVFYRRSSLINHCFHVHSTSTTSSSEPPNTFSFPPPPLPSLDHHHHHHHENLLLQCNNNNSDNGVGEGEYDMPLQEHKDNMAECSDAFLTQ